MDENIRKNPDTAYESQDSDVRHVVLAGVGLVIATAIVFLLMWGLFNALKKQSSEAQTFSPLAEPDQLPPDPRLQVDPSEELRKLRTHEDELLHTYGWVDKNAGKVRIPVDRAMELVLERGLPTGGGTDAAKR